MTRDRVFSGRVIFDHLPKTAGQAINAWLVSELGNGCVTPNLNGAHRQLIRQYGGQYSVVSGHVQFRPGEGLDPRYQYATLLRDPVDRVVSWLYFVINNHDDNQASELRAAVKTYIDSDGRDLPETLAGSIRNVYVEHFCRVFGTGLEADACRLKNSLEALEQYDAIGLYEQLPQFLRRFASLIGVAPPASLAEVNVTKARPKANQISTALRNNISALNNLDLKLYEAIRSRVTAMVPKGGTAAVRRTAWRKYEPNLDRIVVTPDARIFSARLRDGNELRCGQLVTFDVDFFLTNPVKRLEVGIHIFDANLAWTFGINSTMLGHHYVDLGSGFYRIGVHLVVDLPAGAYTAGFALAETGVNETRELAWYDVLCGFQVRAQIERAFAGSKYLSSGMSMIALTPPQLVVFLADDDRLGTSVGKKSDGKIQSCKKEGCLVAGPYATLLHGSYVARVIGRIVSSVDQPAYVEVAVDSGQKVLAREPMRHSASEQLCFELQFNLERSYADVEIRVWVAENHDLDVCSIEIERRYIANEMPAVLSSTTLAV